MRRFKRGWRRRRWRPRNSAAAAMPETTGTQTSGWESGMFAAVSYDEGKTWPVRKLITDGQYRFMDGGAWTGFFETDADRAEPRGYLTMTQSPDGIIHLLSSKNHYRFNLKWLEQND